MTYNIVKYVSETVSVRESEGGFSVWQGDHLLYAGLTRWGAFLTALDWINLESENQS